MKKAFSLALLLLTVLALAAADSDIDQWLDNQNNSSKSSDQDEVVNNDLIKVNYAKKDARLAMAMSMLVPGAGQFYAKRSSITTYIFPALELSFIGGMVYYNMKGNDKTDEYERYANGEVIDYQVGDMATPYHGTRYNRAYQNQVQAVLRNINPVDIYDETYWRLDSNNSQHFYEDIGKYPQYVYGWVDWYYQFATDEEGNYSATDIQWVLTNATDSPNMIWEGNHPLWGDNTSENIPGDSHAASPMRKEYIKMRDESKVQYARARAFTFAIAANHLLSGIDALRLTRKVNRLSITQAVPQMNIYAAAHNGTLTPMVGMRWAF